jgi:hypothetical protein
MIRERTISFTKFFVPDFLDEKTKKDLSEIKSVTCYFDAITEMIEYPEYTEVHMIYPFNPFAEIVKPGEKVINVALTLTEIEGMIEKKKQALEKAKQDDEQHKLAFMEKQAQIGIGVANAHAAAKTPGKIIGNKIN